MSAAGEVEKLAVVQPSTEAPVAQATKKPVKEKKSRTPKQKKPKSAKSVTHPPYFQMIKEALLALNEKGGSSPYAVAKYMEDKHKDELPANFRKILGLQLKNSAAKGKLIKIKASYKLSVAGKEITTKTSTKKLPKADSKKKPISTRSTTTAAKKTEAPKKAKATPKPKKVGAKRTRKSTPAKAKQPKSIKSPAAKRAKKVAA